MYIKKKLLDVNALRLTAGGLSNHCLAGGKLKLKIKANGWIEHFHIKVNIEEMKEVIRVGETSKNINRRVYQDRRVKEGRNLERKIIAVNEKWKQFKETIIGFRNPCGEQDKLTKEKKKGQ